MTRKKPHALKFTSGFVQLLSHQISKRLEDPKDPIHKEWPNARLFLAAKQKREKGVKS
jgi:hypothetical protein